MLKPGAITTDQEVGAVFGQRIYYERAVQSAQSFHEQNQTFSYGQVTEGWQILTWFLADEVICIKPV